jgi:hypothetical protein
LTLGTITFVVKIIVLDKIAKEEHEDFDVHVQFSNILPFFTFIELFDSSFGGNSTPPRK